MHRGPTGTGSERSGTRVPPKKTLSPHFSKMNDAIFKKNSEYLRVGTLCLQKTPVSHSNFFEVIRGQKLIFRLGAPDPKRETLSPGRVGGFCSAQIVPTFGESRLSKFQAVSEIFGVKVFRFTSHNVATDEVSAPTQRHMVEAIGRYNVLDFCDPSLHAAPARGDRSFARIALQQKMLCM